MVKRYLLAAAALALLASALPAQAPNSAGAADLYVTVLRQTNGKPIRNATVVLHEVREDGRQRRGGVQLKTNAEGKTEYRGLPYGKLRVQVIASGHRTWGEDLEISEPRHELVVKLERPQRQHSVYE